MKKYILILSGFISLTLGLIGILLPLLPTTPFVLLSAFCFLHSSKKLHDWLINHKIFGNYIKNYYLRKGITKRHKIFSIVFLWLSISISIFLTEIFWLKILLILIAIAVTIHIQRIKNI